MFVSSRQVWQNLCKPSPCYHSRSRSVWGHPARLGSSPFPQVPLAICKSPPPERVCLKFHMFLLRSFAFNSNSQSLLRLKAWFVRPELMFRRKNLSIFFWPDTCKVSLRILGLWYGAVCRIFVDPFINKIQNLLEYTSWTDDPCLGWPRALMGVRNCFAYSATFGGSWAGESPPRLLQGRSVQDCTFHLAQKILRGQEGTEPWPREERIFRVLGLTLSSFFPHVADFPSII